MRANEYAVAGIEHTSISPLGFNFAYSTESGQVVSGRFANKQPAVVTASTADFRDFRDRTILSQVFGITPLRKK